jgi:hypothetical protein
MSGSVSFVEELIRGLQTRRSVCPGVAMRVKGILFEGRDGQEYLLGFGILTTGQLTGPPTLSRRGPDGTFQLFG